MTEQPIMRRERTTRKGEGRLDHHMPTKEEYETQYTRDKGIPDGMAAYVVKRSGS
jgi:hypothetical protein